MKVTDGPFTEAKEVVGGFAILGGESKAHAIELTRPFLAVAGDGECESASSTKGRAHRRSPSAQRAQPLQRRRVLSNRRRCGAPPPRPLRVHRFAAVEADYEDRAWREHSVPWGRAEPLAIIADRRSAGWETAAIETVDDAVDLFDWQPRFPVLIVFGHEVDGLPAELVRSCNRRVRIPMNGNEAVAECRYCRRRGAV